jgi:hypothetical protein
LLLFATRPLASLRGTPRGQCGANPLMLSYGKIRDHAAWNKLTVLAVIAPELLL